ncbi:MAG: VWA domain-containing protein [Candidatus Omnitrophica bacterium]|nr:VWA domain-containing protein [Candidatus Omnitrophota bacterium]
MAKFIAANLFSDLLIGFDESKQRTSICLLLAVFFMGLIALARPQWGYQWQEVKRKGLDILLVVDTSKSMLTQDVKPNRLERTKLAVKDLIKRLKGDRIGLVAFAGDAFMMCPLTSDYGGFLMSLNDLKTGIIPRGGTNVAGAIEEAMKGYSQTPAEFKTLILVTDGDNLEGDPLAAAKKAKEKGVKIFTVGVGTQEGDLIRIQTDQGQADYLKDANGNVVKSRLNESLLQRMALETGGAYVRSSGAEFGLDFIYERYLSKIEKREIEEKMQKKYFERFQIPLAVALMFLLVDTMVLSPPKKEGLA